MRKKAEKLLSVLLALLFLPLVGTGTAEETENWMMFSSRTEPYYSEYRKGLTAETYRGEEIAASMDRTRQTGDTAEVTLTVGEEAL